MLAIDILNNSQRLILRPGNYLVGRGHLCNICISHPSVSKNHFILHSDGGYWTIEDCGSTNGTAVNGETIRTQTRLDGSAAIQIGKIAMTVREIDPTDVVAQQIAAVPIYIELEESTHQVLDFALMEQKIFAIFHAFLNDVRHIDDFFQSALPALFMELGIIGYGIMHYIHHEIAIRFSWGKDCAAIQNVPKNQLLKLASRTSFPLADGALYVIPFAIGAQVLQAFVVCKTELCWEKFSKQLETHLINLSKMLALMVDWQAAAAGEQPERAQAKQSHLSPLPHSQSALFISTAMKRLYDEVLRISASKGNVILEGETGTGKEVLASLIHYFSRCGGNFIPVMTSALPENLIERELFGHRRGSFTGATQDQIGKFVAADAGTIFLDEVADMPLNVQSKLLRVLENGEVFPIGESKPVHVDVRVVAASNIPFQALIDDKRLRKDIYFRLKTFKLSIPPLRERRDEVMPLFHHFIQELHTQYKKTFCGITPKAITLLENYTWPGNIRELKNEVQRLLAIMGDDGLVSTEILSDEIRQGNSAMDAVRDNFDIKESVGELEKKMIVDALRATAGNKSQAAQRLNLSRLGLSKKMKKLGIANLV